MPFDVAVETRKEGNWVSAKSVRRIGKAKGGYAQPDAGVVSTEPDHNVAAPRDLYCVSADRVGGLRVRVGWIVGSVVIAANNLERMAVEMDCVTEWMVAKKMEMMNYMAIPF